MSPLGLLQTQDTATAWSGDQADALPLLVLTWARN